MTAAYLSRGPVFDWCGDDAGDAFFETPVKASYSPHTMSACFALVPNANVDAVRSHLRRDMKGLDGAWPLPVAPGSGAVSVL